MQHNHNHNHDTSLKLSKDQAVESLKFIFAGVINLTSYTFDQMPEDFLVEVLMGCNPMCKFLAYNSIGQMYPVKTIVYDIVRYDAKKLKNTILTHSENFIYTDADQLVSDLRSDYIKDKVEMIVYEYSIKRYSTTEESFGVIPELYNEIIEQAIARILSTVNVSVHTSREITNDPAARICE